MNEVQDQSNNETEPVILVVDDNPTNLKVLTNLLADSGFEILVARDGESGLERAQYIQPDLILLDIVLPTIDGFEICRRLKANEITRNIPVIFITAHATETDKKVKGFEMGGVDFIAKPIQQEEVLARITTHLRIRELTQSLQQQTVALQREITERKQTEAELNVYREHLEEMVKERTVELTEVNVALKREIIERKRGEEQIKASLDEKEVLLQEIHHRVKNNMQVIAGLLDLQAGYVEEPKVQAILLASQNRIRSMALTHEQLYQSSNLAQIDFAEYVGSLISYLSQSYVSQASRLTWQTHLIPLALKIETAIPCGLIINELVTNAIKHAFPSGQPGEIRIGLQETPDQHLILEVSDNGVGFPAEG